MPAYLKHAFKFLLGAAALWALVRSGSLDPALVGRAFMDHPGLCALAFLSFAALILLPAWIRWFLLLRMAGLQVAAGRTFRLHMIGIFFNGLIPGGTGGDLVKGFYLFKDHAPGHRALALTSMAMDRFLGLYALLTVGTCMSLLTSPLWMGQPYLRLNCLLYATLFLVFTAAIAFFFSPWSRWFLEHPKLHSLPGGRFFKSLSESLLVYRSRPSGLLPCLGLAVLVDFGLILLYYFFARALGSDLPLLHHAFVVPTLTMINGIPISPAGLGVGEAAGKVIYGFLGLGNGGEVLALVHIAVLAFSLSGMPFYFLFKAREPAGPADVAFQPGSGNSGI
jgi:uncharacterized membrane protein YbhN (UPF0104 family)